MADQLSLTALSATRDDVRMDIARLWRSEIARQPMGLVADDGTKVLALAELTLRIVEQSDYQGGGV